MSGLTPFRENMVGIFFAGFDLDSVQLKEDGSNDQPGALVSVHNGWFLTIPKA